MGTTQQLQRAIVMGAVALTVGALAACGSAPAPSGPGAAATNPSSSATRGATHPTATSPTTGTGTPATAPTGTATVFRTMPVYFVGESAGSFRLFREFRTVSAIDGPISSTISAMTRLAPLDPDYLNPWRSASRVYVSDEAATLTVDLSADAFRNRNVGSELASVAIQQLVYTALAAAHVAGNGAQSVVVTVDGQRYDAWGVEHLEGRIDKEPLIDVQAQAWVTSPQEGDRVPAGRVQFTGYGTSFEGTFHWTVTASSGKVVAQGSAMGGSMGTFGTVRFSANLQPGGYVVKLATDDPSGGEGHGPATDTKYFTVR